MRSVTPLTEGADPIEDYPQSATNSDRQKFEFKPLFPKVPGTTKAGDDQKVVIINEESDHQSMANKAKK